jgi:CRP/FNR family transcriptional regulator, nitrogen fixation regulation protein
MSVLQETTAVTLPRTRRSQLRQPSHKHFEVPSPVQMPLRSVELPDAVAITKSLAHVGMVVPFRSRRRFCSEGARAEYVFRIIDGVAEGYHITSDGRRQIVGFYSAGDIFGVEAGKEYSIFVDAITGGRIQVIERSRVAQLISSNSQALPELWLGLAARIHRSQEHILRLGRPAADRIAGFILEMCARLSGRDDCHLPMTRQEMADHLGLTIETVSRTLTHLRQAGIITLIGNRDIYIRDRQRLRRLTC